MVTSNSLGYNQVKIVCYQVYYMKKWRKVGKKSSLYTDESVFSVLGKGKDSTQRLDEAKIVEVGGN